MASPCGDKYNFASRPEHADKIAIVGARWLLDCEKRGELLDIDDYKFSREELRGVKEDDDDNDLDFSGVASLSVGEALDKLLLSSDTGRRSVPPGPLFSRCQFCLLGFEGPNGRAASSRKRGSRTSNDKRGGDERAQLKESCADSFAGNGELSFGNSAST